MPTQFLHPHRVGHGAVPLLQTQRGFTAFVHRKMAQLQDASGIHTGTMGYGKTKGETADEHLAYMLDAIPPPAWRRRP